MDPAVVLMVVGLAIVVALNPPGISLVMLLLMGEQSRSKSWLYVGGSLVTETVVIFGVLWLIRTLGNVTVNPAHAGRGGDLVALITAVFGVSFIASGFYMLTGGKNATDDVVKRVIGDIDHVKGYLVFVAGMIMISKSVPIVAAGQISQAGAPPTNLQIAILYAVYIVIALSTVVVPIVLSVTRPEQSKVYLERSRTWLEVHGGRLAAIVTLFFGLVFAVRGFGALLG